jgi:lipid A 3-O-deacylase
MMDSEELIEFSEVDYLPLRMTLSSHRRFTCLLGAGLLSLPSITWAGEKPFETASISLETGALWQIGVHTPLDYTLIPNQVVYRSADVLGWSLEGGSSIALRHRFALLGTYFAEGPETLYVGLSASPSLEWWAASGTWGLYMGAGGGAGWLDDQDVEGAQGQSFTLNWFAQLGAEWMINDGMSLRAGMMFQHMSNGGMTTPNPGIDALGFTVSASWKF